MTETRDSKLETRAGAEEGPGYTRLDAWRLADELAVELFGVTKGLVAQDRWLRSQIMRAAVSVPTNLAEGYSRTSNKELLNYLSIARGSLAEVEHYLHFLRQTRLIDQQTCERLRSIAKRAGQTLFGLMKSVRGDLQESSPARRYLREERTIYDAP